MEKGMILRAEDARDWIYKGEGAANLVLSYCGSSPSLVGKVVRIQKVTTDKTKFVNRSLVLSKYEKLIWADVTELVESSSRDAAGEAFVMHVMSNLLGSEHVDKGIRVRVSREFLETLEKNVHGQRPPWRAASSEIKTKCESALLISDHSVFSYKGIHKHEFCIAVELKPKCGFLPYSDFIARANAIKKQVTRFKMHQLLKLHQGKISRISQYDPLDLFSGLKDRTVQSLKALFLTPQNNLRIFLNGSLIFGGLGGGLESTAAQTCKEDKAIDSLIKATGLPLSSFIELVTEAIFRSGLLDRLLAIQKLDVLDIEAAIHAYYDITSCPCLVCKNLTDAELLHHYSFLHSLPLEKSLKIVRDYLIAATAKDCSMMFSFRPRQDENSESDNDSILLQSSNYIFVYKAYFIDLDMKPLEKMVYYHELDQKIVNFYKKQQEAQEKSYESRDGGMEDSSFNINN